MNNESELDFTELLATMSGRIGTHLTSRIFDEIIRIKSDSILGAAPYIRDDAICLDEDWLAIAATAVAENQFRLGELIAVRERLGEPTQQDDHCKAWTKSPEYGTEWFEHVALDGWGVAVDSNQWLFFDAQLDQLTLESHVLEGAGREVAVAWLGAQWNIPAYDLGCFDPWSDDACGPAT